MFSFLEDENQVVTTEGFVEFASYFGYDETDIAIEGIKEVGAGIRKRINGALETLGKVIRKIVEAIKNFIMPKLKIDTLSVDNGLWKDAQKRLSEIDKVEIGGPIVNSHIKTLLNSPELDIKEKHIPKIKEVIDKREENWNSYKNTYYPDGSEKINYSNTKILIRTAPIAAEKNNLLKNVKDLQDSYKLLEGMSKVNQPNPAAFSAAIRLTKNSLECAKERLHIVTKVINNGIRSNAKEKSGNV